MSVAIDLCNDAPSQGRDEVWILDDYDDINEAPPAALECAQQQAPPAAAEQHTAEVQPTTEQYALDCGCQEGRHAKLANKLQHTAECLQQAGFGQTVDSIAKALSSISCAQCSSLLSAQDAWKLLGPDACSKLYTSLASSVRQVTLAQQGQAAQQADTAQAAAVAEVCCELWGELAALQSLMLGGNPTPSESAPPAAADTPSRPGRRGRNAKQQQAKQPAKPKPKAKKPKYSYNGYGASSGSSGAWATGTGYGGSGGGITKAAQAAMSAAAARQAAADTATTAHLTDITAILQDPLGTSTAAAANDLAAAGPSSRKRGRSAAGLYSGLPWPVCGVVLAGPLAWLLRLLFHNDSLMDVVERQELYSAAMELLR